ncbi:MAG: zinc-ribbon domain-containing protein [Methanomassiliicoccaceae archaeon]|nr:zinc-ribbon domain-containing protein [Methanomassiliicoccaceae archaeon]
MDDINFCPTCGKNLEPGAAYCPACGSRLNDPVADAKEERIMNAANDERIKIAAIVLLIFSSLSIISGIYVYLDPLGLLASLGSIYDMLLDYLTEAELTAIMRQAAVMSMVTGIAGITSAWLAWKRRFWVVALILCLIVSLFGMIFCLIAAWFIYKAKPAFAD